MNLLFKLNLFWIYIELTKAVASHYSPGTDTLDVSSGGVQRKQWY